eukprot:15912951-Heterocapsa_arctica.AAC.1
MGGKAQSTERRAPVAADSAHVAAAARPRSNAAGQPPAQPGEGRLRRAVPEKTEADEDGFTTVSWHLRAQDWTAPLVRYEELATKLEDEQALHAVLEVIDEEQADAAQRLVEASTRAYAVSLVWREKGAPTSAPFGVAGSHRTRVFPVRLRGLATVNLVAPGLPSRKPQVTPTV